MIQGTSSQTDITAMTVQLYCTFAEKPDKPPDEVTAVMTEGGFGEGHFPKAVSRSVDLVLCPGAR